jgi:isoaspartyl peptidase/L-asparaginase-like protein (Ntn-hydrolase superfamily)
MEKTPHVMIVGDGAEHLARELGLDDPTPLLTSDADASYRAALKQQWGDNIDLDDPDAAWRSSREPRYPPLREWAEILRPRPDIPEHWFGTVNFLAMDAHGQMATGVSTSGWGWCYPGRLGDSPVIGAGSFADSRFGAAACTGTGEVTIRTAASRSVVLYMKMGMGVGEAVQEAMADMRDLKDPYVAHINLIAMDAKGNHAGCSYRPEKKYCVMRGGETELIRVPHENPHPWHTGEEGWLLYKHQKADDNNSPTTARL